MATNASPFVVNIVDLQNISLNITGISQASQLTQAQEQIANIQQMVNYDTKTILANNITSFTTGEQVNFLADINLSNTSLYSNGTTVQTTDNSIISTIGNTNSYINVNNNASTISFITAGTQNLQITSTGMLKYTSSPTHFSTGIDIAGFLYVSESGFAKNFVSLSDKAMKTNIQPFFTTVNDVLKLEPCTFTWKTNGSHDIGFIAQEVQAVWPELVTEGSNGLIGLAYSRFVPLLLESIRELNDRLTVVETELRIMKKEA